MFGKRHKKDSFFFEAKESGEVIDKSGWHRPNQYSPHRPKFDCGCVKTTDEGAYRDVTIEMDGETLHFYHQTCIVRKDSEGVLHLNNGGHQTKSTKERINWYLPSGYRLLQRDYEWILSTPGGEREYFNGILIEVADNE